jgi:signal transduction histidine kinase
LLFPLQWLEIAFQLICSWIKSDSAESRLLSEITFGEESMRRSGHKKAVRLDEEQTRNTTNTELIALIEHRLREPLGPTLLVLQLLLREESLSPQGVGLIRMLRRNIKEEVRAITDLLMLMRTFLEDRSK